MWSDAGAEAAAESGAAESAAQRSHAQLTQPVGKVNHQVERWARHPETWKRGVMATVTLAVPY